MHWFAVNFNYPVLESINTRIGQHEVQWLHASTSMKWACCAKSYLVDACFMVRIGHSKESFIHSCLRGFPLQEVPLNDPNHVNGIESPLHSPCCHDLAVYASACIP